MLRQFQAGARAARGVLVQPVRQQQQVGCVLEDRSQQRMGLLGCERLQAQRQRGLGEQGQGSRCEGAGIGSRRRDHQQLRPIG